MKAETNRVEYKQELTDDLEKEVIAFLNYPEGGLIYIGINKTGKVMGVTDGDDMQLKIKDRLKHNILPSSLGLFDIILEDRDEKGIIKIIVASGPEKPYYLRKYGMSEKVTYIRVGSASEPMPGKMIETLFAKRTRNSIGRIQSNQQKLKFEQFKIYYNEAGKKLNSQFAANLELLTANGKYNYVAFLMSDVNSLSVKVAKYKGLNRVELIENNEYGYCSIIKAAKQVLDKIDLENKTLTKITSKERKEKRLWNAIALREAIINAIVHNDYTNEVPPKFELFSDRIEITSAGSLPEGLSRDEFFEGYSVPRNQEIMRIFKDLDLVEHLGSGVPRILESYGKDCFIFSDNFLRMVFPSAGQETDQVTPHFTPHVTPQVTLQVTPQVDRLISILSKEMTRQEIQLMLNLSDRKNFMNNYLNPALSNNLVEMTIPEKPSSRLQKYRLTKKGISAKQNQRNFRKK